MYSIGIWIRVGRKHGLKVNKPSQEMKPVTLISNLKIPHNGHSYIQPIHKQIRIVIVLQFWFESIDTFLLCTIHFYPKSTYISFNSKGGKMIKKQHKGAWQDLKKKSLDLPRALKLYQKNSHFSHYCSEMLGPKYVSFMNKKSGYFHKIVVTMPKVYTQSSVVCAWTNLTRCVCRISFRELDVCFIRSSFWNSASATITYSLSKCYVALVIHCSYEKVCDPVTKEFCVTTSLANRQG